MKFILSLAVLMVGTSAFAGGVCSTGLSDGDFCYRSSTEVQGSFFILDPRLKLNNTAFLPIRYEGYYGEGKVLCQFFGYEDGEVTASRSFEETEDLYVDTDSVGRLNIHSKSDSNYRLVRVLKCENKPE